MRHLLKRTPHLVRSRIVLLALLIGAAFLLGSRTTAAYNTYLVAIPNSSKYGCTTCHTGAYSAATQIKSDFANAGVGNHSWSLVFA